MNLRFRYFPHCRENCADGVSVLIDSQESIILQCMTQSKRILVSQFVAHFEAMKPKEPRKAKLVNLAVLGHIMTQSKRILVSLSACKAVSGGYS